MRRSLTLPPEPPDSARVKAEVPVLVRQNVAQATIARTVLAAVVLYAAIDVALVFLRPQFSILHSAESDYGSAGPWSWLMDLNFLLRCGLSLGAVRAIMLTGKMSGGLRVALTLLIVWALASGLLAFFPDDPAGEIGRAHV